ncbi:molybdopterin molybdotransferase MoeA [Gemmata sp. JC717]|uniref:molybdopterin molybdotransferase MoeA n=1 Tax=Gemmata algarum TaxID=2975278 RepID=UPI0021BA884C|nr:gephyrin-like molybdotransferase Glp [Gemmata algarum]MDY3553061.1 molybdopterin molybdotransferase MoeA [Gemmata algarum]
MSESDKLPFYDVRMKGFRERPSVGAVLELLDSRLRALPPEPVPLLETVGRVLAEPVVSPVDVPSFRKSAMDGFAVRAADTQAPAPLVVTGEAFPARPFTGTVGPGEAVRITTGAPVPDGADAVLMAEFAHVQPDGRVVARSPLTAGKNVVAVGEDVARGREVLPTGRVLRPQDVALAAALGVNVLPVRLRPRVAVLVTGNELLPPGSLPDGFKTADSNSPMLAALAVRDGASVQPVRYVPDDFGITCDAVRAAAAEADVVLISGGTSVGVEDHVPRAVAELGELAVHGVALRPAGPTGIGFVARAAVFLLPGNPASCLCAYDLFAGRAIRQLGGRPWGLPYKSEEVRLTEQIPSAPGRTDFVRVARAGGGVAPVAGGAASLSASARADGFILVPPERGALLPDEPVTVWLYDA